MRIENGRSVYGIVIDGAPSCDDTSGLKPAFDTCDVTYHIKDHITEIIINNRPLLHDALNGKQPMILYTWSMSTSEECHL